MILYGEIQLFPIKIRDKDETIKKMLLCCEYSSDMGSKA